MRPAVASKGGGESLALARRGRDLWTKEKPNLDVLPGACLTFMFHMDRDAYPRSP